MNLPVPQTRTGTLVALTLSVLSLFLYYLFAESSLFDIYNDFYSGSENGVVKAIPSGDTPSNAPDCVEAVYLRVPRFVSREIPGYVYVQVNLKEASQDECKPLTIAFSVNNEKILQIPSLYRDILFVRQVSVDDFPANGTVYARFLLSTEINGSKDMILEINGKKFTTPSDVATVENRWESLKRVFVENLLLPPWSNLLIPVFCFLIVYLREEVKEKDKFEVSEFCKLFVLAALAEFFFATGFYFLLKASEHRLISLLFFIFGIYALYFDYKRIRDGWAVITAKARKFLRRKPQHENLLLERNRNELD